MAAKDSLVKFDPPALVQGKSRKQPAPIATKGSAVVAEDILSAIVPPREYETNGQLWVQGVSSTPATRLDIINLQETLDLRLQQRQARETGICPVREELYAQAFDEIIRQVTINCAERGLLLLRARDEIRMTIAAYQTLYESSVAFGMRKALMAEQRKSELQAKIKILSAEVAELERTVESLTAKAAEMEAADAERTAADEARHAAEVAKLKAANDALREGLEALLAPPSKK